RDERGDGDRRIHRERAIFSVEQHAASAARVDKHGIDGAIVVDVAEPDAAGGEPGCSEAGCASDPGERTVAVAPEQETLAAGHRDVDVAIVIYVGQCQTRRLI